MGQTSYMDHHPPGCTPFIHTSRLLSLGADLALLPEHGPMSKLLSRHGRYDTKTPLCPWLRYFRRNLRILNSTGTPNRPRSILQLWFFNGVALWFQADVLGDPGILFFVLGWAIACLEQWRTKHQCLFMRWDHSTERVPLGSRSGRIVHALVDHRRQSCIVYSVGLVRNFLRWFPHVRHVRLGSVHL
ncbi:hypothetical protein BS47DRAFT_109508 [Hydnum rufescens UP504]|uniref:Uncharacterized protein n=1 Tax=Hydnum rufescens UP504 TaxID=1448309 RepID=A0A9P6AR74_9AGAM|nr:hypothetical protein BS47DRAFT_109508 [Hydnum rufescens UP504]